MFLYLIKAGEMLGENVSSHWPPEWGSSNKGHALFDMFINTGPTMVPCWWVKHRNNGLLQRQLLVLNIIILLALFLRFINKYCVSFWMAYHLLGMPLLTGICFFKGITHGVFYIYIYLGILLLCTGPWNNSILADPEGGGAPGSPSPFAAADQYFF